MVTSKQNFNNFCYDKFWYKLFFAFKKLNNFVNSYYKVILQLNEQNNIF